MAVEYGISRIGDDHRMSLTMVDDGVLVASSVMLGRRVSSAFDLVINPAPSALPNTAKFKSGFALDANDCIYATTAVPSSKAYSFGVCTRLDGAVLFSSSPTGSLREIYHPLLGFCLIDQVGAVYADGFFGLPLSDSGSGAVDTSTGFFSGSATFTRATTAWTKLSSGLWASVASGVARSTYFGQDTAVGGYAGFLSEAAGTQLVTPTASIRDMTNAAWVKVTMTTAKTATGIDGVANSATTLTATGANSTILQTLVAAATSRTYSAFVKRRTGTGTVILKQGTATRDITSLINSTTYTRVQLNDNELNVAFGFQINTSGDAIDVDFNQFESGSFATSPMAAAGAARNADVLTYTFSGNALATVGTCYAELSTLWAISDTGCAAVGTQNNVMYMLGNPTATNTTVISARDGTNVVQKIAISSMQTAVRKRASSWGTGMVITGDGATVATGSFDGDIGSTGIGIGVEGDGSGSAWYGTIKNVKIWTNQRNDLSALTA